MDTNIGDQNTERLIQTAYQPEMAPQAFAADLEKQLLTTAQGLAQQQATIAPPRPVNRWRWAAIALGGVAACGLIAYALTRPYLPASGKNQEREQARHELKPLDLDPARAPIQLARWTDDVRDSMQPRRRPDAPALAVLNNGATLVTKPGKPQLVQLEDGTRLYVQEKSEVEASGARLLTLHKGKIYLEVAAKADAAPFIVKTANREMMALGTHFAVEANPVSAGLVVTQGKVGVKDALTPDPSPKGRGEIEVEAGQQIKPGESKVTTAPRASHSLEWTRELMAAAETPLVPRCQHEGGALIALDPQGQEIKLSLRQYNIDVHIEDGFARTTIDQTYFNTTWERLEGTFYFPLPPDASLSRLAMYVVDGNQCKLMEGGMAERKHAADVYETIRYMRRDPALLEWLDGSTFKMRVFPLEAKQEKRIILSYTQKLPSLYGNTRYRFASGHTMPIVRSWSFTARIKSGAGMNVWSPSHEKMQRVPQTGDVLMTLTERNIKPEADVVLEMQEPNSVVDQDQARFSTFLHENHQYLLLRYRPSLPSLPERKRRDWIILFESSAQRDPIVAGTQVDVVRQLLKNAEYDDTFTLMTVNGDVTTFGEPSPVRGRVSGAKSSDSPDPLRGSARPCRPNNVDEAIKYLQKTHLVGALDLQKGLAAAVAHARNAKNPHIVHVGSGIPAMGERDAAKLAQMLPASATYVGVGVGKRWNRAFMKAAAERTNGLFTQINPDEVIAWRTFDLLATLNTPRLLDVRVVDAQDKVPARFLMETSMIAQGEEICAVTRVDVSKSAVPGSVLVHGTLDGKKWKREFPVINVQSGAGYLPRTWAKQEIDRLLADNAAKHKNEIISLSKAMYVMSPFTSLLVLETDADYERFKVDKGRKDHWAMYPAPAKIPLVYEPEGKVAPIVEKKVDRKDKKPSVDEVLRTMLMPVPDGGTVMMGGIRTAGKLQLGGDVPSFNGPGSLHQQTVRLRILGLNPALNGGDSQGIDFFPPSLALILRAPSRIHTSVTGGIIGGRGRRGSAMDMLSPIYLDSPNAGGDSNGQVDALMLRMLPVTWGKLTLQKEDVQWQELGESLQPRHREVIATYLEKLKDKGKSIEGLVEDERIVRRQLLISDLDRVVDGERHMWGKRKAKLDPTSPKWRAGVTMGIDFAYDVPMRMPDPNMPPGAIIGSPEKAREVAETSSDLFEFWTGLYEPRIRPRNASAGSFRYERPAFNYDRTLFTDLLQYAPGLHTTYADILATLESEAEIESATVGVIDPAARALIERSRAAGWSSLAIAGQGPIPPYKIAYNGLGQFTYERVLGSGLREQVINDGKTLWHLYPEIGLASKRPMSRHHQDLVLAINPAFVPAAEELARGFDVKAMDAATIELIPQAAPQGFDKHHRIRLVFAKDGRLAERCVVEMPGGKVVLKQMLHANGAADWLAGDGKSLGKNERTVKPAPVPSLKADTRDFVVMEMPIRTRDYWLNRWSKDEQPYFVEQTIVSECMTRASGASVMIHFGRHFHQKGDRRLGFYTLLNHAGYAVANDCLPPLDNRPWTIDIEQEHPQNALAMVLAQEARELRTNDQSLLKNIPGPKDGFIQKLAQFRNVWLIWTNQRPIQNGGKDLPIAKSQVMDFLKETTAPTFAYAILDTMQRRCNIAPSEHMMSLAEKRFGPITDPLGLGYVVRYEHARSLWQAGMGTEAGKRFRELHADTLKYGVLPPLDPAFRDALKLPVEGSPRFIVHTRKTLEELLGKKQYRLAFQLAKQMEQLGDEALSEEILSTILAKAPADERQALTLVCANFLAEKKNYTHADRLLVKVLDEPKAAKLPELWRWRSALTSEAGQVATSIACLEKALELEYAELPELVNLESIRADYGTLLNHYQKIAEASASLEGTALTPDLSPKKRGEKTQAFLAKIIRTADRWRLIDPESSQPCMLTGKILHTMGERELAWDYWTTPIDLHPAESKPWLELAETMKTEGDFEKADRAFGVAFEAEPTNPEILWKRAQNAVRLGQPDRARQLYRQIADGAWQDRFQATVEQARGLAAQ